VQRGTANFIPSLVERRDEREERIDECCHPQAAIYLTISRKATTKVLVQRQYGNKKQKVCLQSPSRRGTSWPGGGGSVAARKALLR
jgi:hypothetical protein